MDITLTALNDNGTQALERYYRDSQTYLAKKIANTVKLCEAPLIIKVEPKQLSGLPNSIKKQRGVWETVAHGIKASLEQYGASAEDINIK